MRELLQRFMSRFEVKLPYARFKVKEVLLRSGVNQLSPEGFHAIQRPEIIPLEKGG
jgi:hypothetical protein